MKQPGSARSWGTWSGICTKLQHSSRLLCWWLWRACTGDWICNWVVYPGDKQGTIWVHPKSCCREERKEYNGPPCFWLPQGRGGEQRGPDSTHPVYSFSFDPKTSWAAITEQERFVSLAQVWREGTSICFCEGAGRFVVFPIKLTLQHSTLIPSGSGQ